MRNPSKKREPNAKEQFILAQDQAIQTHNLMNQTRCEKNADIEQLIFQYQKLEEIKFQEIQTVFQNFASRMEIIGEKFQQLKTSFIPHDDFKALEKEVDIYLSVMPKADLNLQFVPVPVELSAKVNPMKMYGEEIKAGKKLYKVTNSFFPFRGHLPVQIGEIVVEISDDSENITCRNINDLIGLIPKSCLTQYKFVP